MINKKTTLPNGLTVITSQLPAFNSATVAVFVKSGSNNETKETNGIAHFMEHLAFKSSLNRTTQQIVSEIENLGSNMNAYTSNGTTCYYISGLKENVNTSLEILGDMMTKYILDRSDIDTERGVILQEIAKYLDDPSSVAGDGFGLTMYPDQAAGRTILGDPEFIKTATRDDFVNYMNKNYVTKNMVVAGCGGIDSHEEFCDMVQKHFDGLLVGEAPVLKKPVYVGGMNKNSGNFEQVNLYVGFKSVEDGHPDGIRNSIFAASFGSGMSSPLFQEIREKRGLVYSVGAYNNSGFDEGSLTIYGGMTPENVDTFMSVLCEELTKFTSNPQLSDLNRVKTQNTVYYRCLQERPFTLIKQLTSDYFETGNLIDPNSYVAKVQAITLDDLKQAGRDMLSTNPTISMVGPVSDTDYHSLVKSAF